MFFLLPFFVFSVCDKNKNQLSFSNKTSCSYDCKRYYCRMEGIWGATEWRMGDASLKKHLERGIQRNLDGKEKSACMFQRQGRGFNTIFTRIKPNKCLGRRKGVPKSQIIPLYPLRALQEVCSKWSSFKLVIYWPPKMQKLKKNL